jgi:hypothetical protein
MPTVNPPPPPAPRTADNISQVPPAAHSGGEVKITGTGTDRRIVDVAGPYVVESPRQPRDR